MVRGLERRRTSAAAAVGTLLLLVSLLAVPASVARPQHEPDATPTGRGACVNGGTIALSVDQDESAGRVTLTATAARLPEQSPWRVTFRASGGEDFESSDAVPADGTWTVTATVPLRGWNESYDLYAREDPWSRRSNECSLRVWTHPGLRAESHQQCQHHDYLAAAWLRPLQGGMTRLGAYLVPVEPGSRWVWDVRTWTRREDWTETRIVRRANVRGEVHLRVDRATPLGAGAGIRVRVRLPSGRPCTWSLAQGPRSHA